MLARSKFEAYSEPCQTFAKKCFAKTVKFDQFDQYLNPHQTFMSEANLSDDKVKEALRSLKPNKSPGYDNISSNVVNETSDIFFTP